MALLDDVFEANGGLHRWRSLERFTVHFSIGGALLSSKTSHGALKELVAQGSTRASTLRVIGCPAPDQCAAYRSGRITIETIDGMVLASRDNPETCLHSTAAGERWDDLHLAYYCGSSIWNCLASVFLLAESDVYIENLSPWNECSETWQRVMARFPATAVMPAREEVFYFDRYGLLRRTDYAAMDMAGRLVSQYSWAHQDFSGIVVPTLHCRQIYTPDATKGKIRSHTDIEVFDVRFD